MRLDLGQPAVSIDTNILNVEIPEQMEQNVSTGMPFIDALFGGDGITPGASILFTGRPGQGKSTLCLQIADSITKTGNIALYNTGEESLYQVRKTVRRLGLKNGFVPSYEHTAQEIVAHAKNVQAANPGKTVFLFVDSLQTVEFDQEETKRGRPVGSGNLGVLVSKHLTEWAKQTFGVLIVIGQVGKDGVFLGKNEIKHIVDSHLNLDVDTDRKSDTYGRFIATMEKNRMGQSHLMFPYHITGEGIKFEE